MSEAYDETVEGERLPRRAPGTRHEIICARLHKAMQASVADYVSTHLLAPRAKVSLNSETILRPDLALIAAQTGKIWLAAEIVSSDDHRVDTVIKKQIYEDFRLPRLWMIDPRYDNVEVYHGSEYGLILKAILAGSEILSEKLLPEFQICVADLFTDAEPAA
jgi:Uma2 family endonuclease